MQDRLPRSRPARSQNISATHEPELYPVEIGSDSWNYRTVLETGFNEHGAGYLQPSRFLM